MSIGATDKEWIILISSFVFSMDMIVIPILSIALLTLSLKDVVISLLHTSFHS